MAFQSAFQSVFLDTCIVHYLASFPDLYFEEGSSHEESQRIGLLSSAHVEDLYALRRLVHMGSYGWPHDIVITSTVVRELPSRTRWYGWHLLDYCTKAGFVSDDGPHSFIEEIFGSVLTAFDPSDRRLLVEAALNGCDAFLTTDYRTIIRRRRFLQSATLKVLTPSEWLSRVDAHQ